MTQQPADPRNDFFYKKFILLQKEHSQTQQKYAHIQQEHARILDQLSIALQSNADQSAQIQILKDEIARLKKTSPCPKLPPGRLEGSDHGSGGTGGKGQSGRGKHPRKNKRGLNFHNTKRLKPDNIPEGAIFKGTRKYDVQNIVCQAYNTRYIIVIGVRPASHWGQACKSAS